MQILSVRIDPLLPPRDSLRAALKKAKFIPKESDIVCVSSKVVSIDEGRALPISSVPDKDRLVKKEADLYLEAVQSPYRRRFTITKGHMASSAGIDESNADGHYILYPKNPFKSAKRLRAWIQKEYGLKEIAVIITDSVSLPLRRGAIGFALAWDGIDPLRDYRGTKDIFGRTIRVEVSNRIDALAATAVLLMGEGAERTPVALIRGAKNIVLKNRSSRSDTQLLVKPTDDVFASLLFRKGLKWKRGGEGKKSSR